ncbi:MAG: hypothetical protein EXR69_09460 [Myxococcales bacterium]|nr:hypothetical protein [Myxococcales bacterium]
MADHPFSARPSGYLIPAFTAVLPAAGDERVGSGYDLDARLGGEARLDLGRVGQVGALIEVKAWPAPVLKDAYALYRPAPFLRFDIGQFKVPYSLAFLASDTRRLLPVAPQALSGMVGRDLGVMMTASLPIRGRTLGSLQLAAMNGEGPNHPSDADGRYLYAMRGVITPLGARTKPFEGSDGSLYLGLGGAWVHDRSLDSGRESPVNQFAGELQFSWAVLSIQGEFVYGDRPEPVSGTPHHRRGGYGTLSAFLPFPGLKEHVQLVGRFGQSDPDDAAAGPTAGELSSTRELALGLNLYWFGAPGPFNDLKLQLAFLHYDELEGTGSQNDTLTSAATVRF